MPCPPCTSTSPPAWGQLDAPWSFRALEMSGYFWLGSDSPHALGAHASLSTFLGCRGSSRIGISGSKGARFPCALSDLPPLWLCGSAARSESTCDLDQNTWEVLNSGVVEGCCGPGEGRRGGGKRPGPALTCRRVASNSPWWIMEGWGTLGSPACLPMWTTVESLQNYSFHRRAGHWAAATEGQFPPKLHELSVCLQTGHKPPRSELTSLQEEQVEKLLRTRVGLPGSLRGFGARGWGGRL